MKKWSKSTFRALQHPNFRIFITGQAISRIGTWMERTAVSWVVYDVTDSNFMLGLAAFCSQFPMFIFSLYGGILSDRYNQHTIVLITQIASLLQATLLAVLIYTNNYHIWHILALVTLLGIINAFDVPARQSLMNRLVTSTTDLQNAVALNSSIVNIARLVGPALAGIILSKLGASICFTLNAVSYLAVIISLFLLKLTPHKIKTKTRSNLDEIKDGINYLKLNKQLGILTIYIGFIALLVSPYITLLPDFAKDMFHGDAETFGYITSCIGFGAFLGSLFLAAQKETNRLTRVLLVNAVLLGISLMLFAYMTYLPIALLLTIITGFSGLTQSTICLTIIQTKSAPEMRGRMISLFAMSLFGMLPLGGLLVGLVSHAIGSSLTVFLEGISAVLIAAIFYFIRTKNNTLSQS
ncbi:MFS transporter [Neptunitalea lumnitzerae]|uniref:MFS transporter n=1 Tax=Neptunitalea lumnitzerae TaxID=2965509 RepID=A0ABQ5MFH7_9FLAO|nr:MFS transporter [Neptunitalea sp. Y10]GLB48152.1 MFS transporter [Neptunitalea sp. Y10]